MRDSRLLEEMKRTIANHSNLNRYFPHITLQLSPPPDQTHSLLVNPLHFRLLVLCQASHENSHDHGKRCEVGEFGELTSFDPVERFETVERRCTDSIGEDGADVRQSVAESGCSLLLRWRSDVDCEILCKYRSAARSVSMTDSARAAKPHLCSRL